MPTVTKSKTNGKAPHKPARPRTKQEILEATFRIALADARATLAKLSPRQTQLAELMADGLSNFEIAGRLGISPKTGDIHRGDLYQRTGEKTPAGVARLVWIAKLADVL